MDERLELLEKYNKLYAERIECFNQLCEERSRALAAEKKLELKEEIIKVMDQRNREIWEEYNTLQFYKALWKPLCFEQYEENNKSCEECPAEISCKICSKVDNGNLEGTDDA